MALLIGVSGSIEKDYEKVFLLRAYMRALESVSLTPVLLSPDTRGQALCELLGRLDGLMLAGGYDVDPDLYGQEPMEKLGTVTRLRDDFELPLVTEAVNIGIPTLGICRGVQAMNVALGGTLIQDIPSQLPNALIHQSATAQPAFHDISVTRDSPLYAIMGGERAYVNSYHHQSILKAADELTVCATAPDGVIEAVYHAKLPYFLGVQWHPERTYETDAVSKAIFSGFADACAAYAHIG